ncbi:mitochondrial glycerol-3-phosphate dehydrogenase [Rhizophlyctis rosea]|nr:mitochondrial glycerol-3-phosphate dehydrogenase [Rhizophlyctis rosea]
MIHVSETGLLTVAGGKWTTYRAMAEEAVGRAVEVFGLHPTGPCVTEHIPLIGSHHWSKNMFVRLIQHFGLETEVAQHLCDSYGDRAWAVASMATLTHKRWPVYGKRLSFAYPYIEAEVRYAVRREYACTVVDVIARRTRLAFLNAEATLEALPRIINIMASELDWSDSRKSHELHTATIFLSSMGLSPHSSSSSDVLPLPTLPSSPTSPPTVGQKETTIDPTGTGLTIGGDQREFSRAMFTPYELEMYRGEFERLDGDGDGCIRGRDLRKVLKRVGLEMSEEDVEAVIKEVDLDGSGGVEFKEFLEVLAAVKEIRSRSRFARIVAAYEDKERRQRERRGVGGEGVEWSGGGV